MIAPNNSGNVTGITESESATPAWVPANKKPKDFETVYLWLAGDDVTTGWWSSAANRWIGLAYNQSPPTYDLPEWVVKFWKEITPPALDAESVMD